MRLLSTRVLRLPCPYIWADVPCRIIWLLQLTVVALCGATFAQLSCSVSLPPLAFHTIGGPDIPLRTLLALQRRLGYLCMTNMALRLRIQRNSCLGLHMA